MKLEDIINGCGVLEFRGNGGTEIVSITADSRKACPGSLFIAVKGFAGDGHSYIAEAVRRGAAAVIYEDEKALGSQLNSFGARNDAEAKAGTSGMADSLALVKVSSSRRAVAIAAANFFGNPSKELTLVGITGTNGKTTTVTLLYNLFTGLGYRCGLLSTIANYVGPKRSETENTTADPITINSLLREMVDDGCSYCFMEVSSIGVEQERVSGLHFKAGIFSNLTHDHLDYHKTFAEYLRCKKLFFDNLPADAFAIINTDDKNGYVMVQNTAARIVTYSCRSMAADHRCRLLEQSFDGMLLRMDGQEIWSRLIGRHNVYNLLAIYTTAVTLGADSMETLTALSRLGPAPGRLETLRGPEDITVVIDYAHTPDALDNVLVTLREVARDRQLICVFGCGGDRDKTKRPEMAAIAQKCSDRIFVTSDNSRSEKIEDIFEDIRKGFSDEGLAKSLFIADRREAIRTAIMTAAPGAAVLLAGKGHETYQIDENGKHSLDEREVVEEVFGRMKNLNKR